jgi:signal transduction histidine kinase
MPERRLAVGANLRSLAGNRQVLVLLLLSAVLLTVAVTAVFLASRSLSQSNARVEHTLRVQAAINQLIALNERVETARRGYLLAPDASFIQILQGAQSDLEAQIRQAEALLGGEPNQLERLKQVQSLNEKRAPIVSDTILYPRTMAATTRDTGIDKDPGVIITWRIRAIGGQMVDAEEETLFRSNRAQVQSQQSFYLLGGTATVLLFLTLGAVILLVLRYNRQLGLAQASLRLANEGLESAVATRTAELTRANAEIQRFAYIVSHDLRSPLVNVLGFTSELNEARKTIRAFLEQLFEDHPELKDEATWLAVDEDLPEALDFIRKSTEKMDRLINSILELSRQGRRPLTPERLDMNALVDGVVSSRHQRAQDAGAEVVVEPLPAIQSDRIAVEQILSNLIENALKYLSPSRAGKVSVSGRREKGMIEIAVRDNGRGIDPADHERVFDLFRRAGTQDQPGEGIGLANVRALAYRLGGNVTLDSKLDGGSVFTLSLPEQFTALDTFS